MSRDHVAISTGSGVHWHFIVPAAATTCTEQTEEMTELCTRMFDAFGDFLTPVGLEYGIWVYAEDQGPPYDNDAPDPVKKVERKLHDKSGVTPSDFVDSTQVDHAGARWMPQIQFDHNWLKIRFPDGDRFVERSDCVSYAKGEPVNRNPTWGPIELNAWFRTNTGYEEIDSEYVFDVGVHLYSDVWIERTESGGCNRAYLSEFLDRLADAVPFERERYGSSDFWTDLGIQSRTDQFDPEEIY